MEIGKFSKEMQVPIDTLRYYDKIGLLVPSRKGYKRAYSSDDLEKMKVIKKLKSCDFALDEIKILFGIEDRIEQSKIEDTSDDLSDIKDMFLHKKNHMSQVLMSLNEGIELIDKVINKLDQVMEKPEIINEIVGKENEY